MEDTIFFFEFDLCSLRHRRDVPLGCWLRISSVEGVHRWLAGACVFLLRGVFDFAENSEGAFWIHRIWKIQYFCSSLICVVCDINEMSLWVVDFVFLLLKLCIGDWQAPVSSSSEGCSTWQKPNQGAYWIPRLLKIQYLCSSLIWVVCDMDKTSPFGD